MAETADAPAGPAVQPLTVAYDPITGVPSEYNEFLPKDCDEYKRWKAAASGDAAVAGEMAGLAVGDAGGAAPPAAEPAAADKSSSKKKKKGEPMVVLEKNTRNKKKSITVIAGLDTFGVKLGEASKIFGKKFASGCAVVKTAEGKEQIECQGDFLDQAAELILKQFKTVAKKDIYVVESKKKVRYFDDEDDE